ncbi:tRNA dihydrouridine synthase [Desulfonauticus submarinus]
MSLPLGPRYPWLAPLAGFSDLPFRLVCRKYGCDLAFTEMVSASGLIYNSKGTFSILKTCAQDSPLIVQLFGADPKIIFKAVNILKKLGFKYFDLNCGCSVKKVIKTGSGAYLLTQIKKIEEIVKTIQSLVPAKQVGIKARLGYSLKENIYLKLGEKMAKLGIGWFTLHPRYAKQKFSGTADWNALKKLKHTFPELKVIGSGDIFTAEDGINCLSFTQIDGIMFARGALSNPFIFQEYKALLQQKSITIPKSKIIAQLLLDFAKYYPKFAPQKAVLKMRTLLPKMIKNIPEAKKIRHKLTSISSWEQVIQIANQLKEE